MKKLFLLGAAALMLTGVGCKGNAGSTSDLKTQEDSLAYYFGQMWGNGVGSELMNAPEGAKFDKAEIIKGMQVAFAADTTQKAYIQGLQIGLTITGQLQALAAQDSIDVDKALLFAAFKEAFLADSVASPQAAQAQVMSLIQKIKTEKMANSPEAIANKNAGEAYIAEQMKKDPSLKKTESGLVYKVIAEGEGVTIKASDRVKVKYTGKHIDGKEFDTSGDEPRVFSPSGVVPGFGEGLKMMKPGAHYILYIPGDLAYGVEGQPYAGIKANETLVFDVEVVGLAD